MECPLSHKSKRKITAYEKKCKQFEKETKPYKLNQTLTKIKDRKMKVKTVSLTYALSSPSS